MGINRKYVLFKEIRKTRVVVFLIQNKFEDRLKKIRRENLLFFILRYKHGRRLRKRNASKKYEVISVDCQ